MKKREEEVRNVIILHGTDSFLEKRDVLKFEEVLSKTSNGM